METPSLKDTILLCLDLCDNEKLDIEECIKNHNGDDAYMCISLKELSNEHVLICAHMDNLNQLLDYCNDQSNPLHQGRL